MAALAPLPAILLFAGCHSSGGGKVEGGEAIACQLPGQSGFKTICTIERNHGPNGTVLTVRGPDGGFRRLLVVKDGRGVVAADGAEEVKVERSGSASIDVTADDVVYRLPARISE